MIGKRTTRERTTADFIGYLLRSCDIGFSRCETPVSVRELAAPNPAIRYVGHRPRR
jgi:hypothetical protein